MSVVLTCFDNSKNYSYQHIHGLMLVNLNKIASKLSLTHTEYHLMGILIGLWNKEKGIAFPTIEYLVNNANMSKSTVLRSLKRLIELKIISIQKQKGKRNKYYFSETLFQINTKNVLPLIPQTSITCDTTHDNKQNRLITNKITSSNDDILKNTTISDLIEYKKIILKLKSWNFSGAKQIIHQKGIKNIENLINQVEKINPDNKGAYFRVLINAVDTNCQLTNNSLNINAQRTQIEQMLKYKFWKHKPTNKIYQIKPDFGSHLLVRYFKNENMVELFDYNLIDNLDNFEIAECYKLKDSN
ncbi:MAG: helix-turn-helix domain-containing protein [Vampirovibrionia bacterium]